MQNRVYKRTPKLHVAKQIITACSAILLVVCVVGFTQFGVTPGGGGRTPQCALGLARIVRAMVIEVDDVGKVLLCEAPEFV